MINLTEQTSGPGLKLMPQFLCSERRHPCLLDLPLKSFEKKIVCGGPAGRDACTPSIGMFPNNSKRRWESHFWFPGRFVFAPPQFHRSGIFQDVTISGVAIQFTPDAPGDVSQMQEGAAFGAFGDGTGQLLVATDSF